MIAGIPRLSRRRRLVLAVFVGYAALSLALHDRVPFCEFDMFARLPGHPRTASFRVDGVPASIGGFSDFDIRLPPVEGDLTSLQPNGGDQNLSLNEMFSYVRAHPAAPVARGPLVDVEFLLLSTEWDEISGRPVVSSEVFCRGTARRKP
jgi:hypothetical protein